jgi:hypothetical protein
VNAEPVGDTDVKVVLCVSTYKRTEQLMLALPLNVCISWRYRAVVRWMLADLNDPSDSHDLVAQLETAIPVSLVEKQLRYGRRDWGAGNDQKWQGWHASVAKNTSHVMAQTAYGREVVLCNVDGDNLITQQHLDTLLTSADKMIKWKGVGGVSPKTVPEIVGMSFKAEHNASTTGRIALGGRVFQELHGYDEEFGPSGGQDVDLSRRLGRFGFHRRIESTAEVGNALWNHLDQCGKKRRGNFERTAKVANVSAGFRDATWDQINTANIEMMRRKLTAGILRRNEGNDIGVQMVEVAWRQTQQRRTAASSAAASSGGVSPDVVVVHPVKPAETTTPRPIGGSSSSSSTSIAIPSAIAMEKLTFAIYTFGVDKLAGRYDHSKFAQQIRDMVSLRGGPPVPIPGALVFPP